jgi:hypothetical protein
MLTFNENSFPIENKIENNEKLTIQRINALAHPYNYIALLLQYHTLSSQYDDHLHCLVPTLFAILENYCFSHDGPQQDTVKTPNTDPPKPDTHEYGLSRPSLTSNTYFIYPNCFSFSRKLSPLPHSSHPDYSCLIALHRF